MSVKTNLGRVGLVPRGEYEAESSYRRLDFVVYGGSSYVALADTRGVAPDAEHVAPAEDAVWALLAERGDDGISPAFTFSAQTGEPGTQVRLEQSGTPQAPHIQLTVPRGEDGANGVTPDITVTVEAGEPGTQAQVRQSGTPEHPALHFIIPAGEQGPAGRTEGVPYADSPAAALGKASPGVSEEVSRADHVHEMPTAADVGARPGDWMPTAADIGAVTSVNGQTPDESGNVAVDGGYDITLNGHAITRDNPTADLTAADVGARADTWTPTAQDVGAIPDTIARAELRTAAGLSFSLEGTTLTITVSD